MNKINIVYNEDCFDTLKKINNKSIDLICIDPPYWIAVAWVDWDFWKNKKKIKEYNDFMFKVFDEVDRVLKENGNFIFFHNDFEVWSIFNNYLKNKWLVYKWVVHLIKEKFRSLSWKNPWDNNKLRSLFNITEQFFVYTRMSETWLERIVKDVNNFKNLKDYSFNLLSYIWKTYREINKELKHRRSEHFFYNDFKEWKNKINKELWWKIDHFSRVYSSQWWLPTKKTYNELTEKYNLKKFNWYKEYEDLRKEYEDLRKEYEDLRKEYEDLRPIHNLFENHNNVWIWDKYNSWKKHPTQKPEWIMERIIKIFTKEWQVVLDFFAWSWSTLIAAKKLKRNYIWCEKEKNFYDIIIKELNE